VLIRTRVNEIREMSRATQGVTLINLGEGEKLSGLQTIMDRDDENGENGNGNGGNGHGANGNGHGNDNGSEPAPH
jgi:DNA gyrase subunit A